MKRIVVLIGLATLAASAAAQECRVEYQRADNMWAAARRGRGRTRLRRCGQRLLRRILYYIVAQHAHHDWLRNLPGVTFRRARAGLRIHTFVSRLPARRRRRQRLAQPFSQTLRRFLFRPS